jgi:hypothetical protein
MKNIKLLSLFFILSVFACKEKSRTEIELQNIEERKENYRIEKIIPLETINNNFLGLNLKIKKNSRGYFVMDESNRDAIHYFNLQGKYIRQIAIIGEGPNNVPSLYDFILEKEGISILSGKGDHSDITLFTYDNELINKIELEVLSDSFEILENNNYILYSGYNLPLAKFRLNEVSRKGKTINQFLPNTYENEMLPMSENNFYRYNGQVYFKESFNPSAYIITKDSLELKYKFDFGSYKISERFWEVDIMQGFEMISTTGFANIYNYIENEKYSIFEIYIQKPGSVQNVQVIINKKNDKIYRNTISKDNNDIFYNPEGITENNEVIFITHPTYLIEAIRNNIITESEFKEIIDSLNENDNPVLLICSIK